MAQDLKSTGKKVLGFLGAAAAIWAVYSVVFKKKKVSSVIKEEVKPVQNIVKEVERVTKNLVKGSPEAKSRMAELRKNNKTPRGQGRRAKRKKYLKEISKKEDHKGHETKQGLSQDQKLVSQEIHEQNYQEAKKEV